MKTSLQHLSLGSRLDGITVGITRQFRGIPYGHVPARFEASVPAAPLPSVLVCSEYGPRCPQNAVDVRHLLRIPLSVQQPVETEDEFGCLNLDVVLPASSTAAGSLPVIVWIHGGSQVVTFASAASGVCDPTHIVEDSVGLGRPLIFVSLNYRLNLFGFGNGKEKNLALRDQGLGLSWVWEHIAGFGGDPGNITIAGESAGAVFCHAHVVTGQRIRRVILSSGSLHLSPPLPEAQGTRLIQNLRDHVKEETDLTLEEASSQVLLNALKAANVQTLWLQATPELEGWAQRLGHAEALLVGDVEYESIIWARALQKLSAEEISDCFDSEGSPSSLKDLYGIVSDRPTSCVNGALDFLTDLRFALPVEVLQSQWASAGRDVYRYLVDQTNPWQKSNRAHHAVDLLFLFGGIDMAFDLSADRIGRSMRCKWISFANGHAPWSPKASYGFGPNGLEGELDDFDLSLRRRSQHLRTLRQMDQDMLARIFRRLAAGRISLLD